ncbi:hypothetical protein DY000_02052844 [Brassica cretica]|uniref:Uncharacterized protein n=1 Tax=Brassica cretica TaxID=69181 RepID=A0ABQ7AKQ9_BRACR|nr:hypothetical protein DY000_02052844 [Brassica cretica]
MLNNRSIRKKMVDLLGQARGFLRNPPNGFFFIGFPFPSSFFISRSFVADTPNSGTIIIMSKRPSSSVPTAADRARVKRRMDSPVSRSDSSWEPCEGSDCDLMATLPLSCVYATPPLVGPGSSVGEDEMAEWRRRYLLPSYVILRAPTAEERASSYIPGEIAVYEAFFDSGLRGVIPTLIVGLCNLFEISPSQLNPPAWRILIAIQNLGDLEYLSLGINEVMFAYHLSPLNGGEGRFHLLAAACRSWTSFQKPGLTLLQQKERELLSGHDSFLYIVARNMAGGVANDPFTAYQEAAKVMSAKKGSSSRSASEDEEIITGSRRSTEYKAVVQEEARNKGAPPPTFEDEPAIPPVSEMDVDLFVKPRGSPT